MEIGLIALAIILASLLGWLLKQSFNTTPWIAEAVEESSYQAPFNAGPKLVALTAFLAVATSFSEPRPFPLSLGRTIISFVSRMILNRSNWRSRRRATPRDTGPGNYSAPTSSPLSNGSLSDC